MLLIAYVDEYTIQADGRRAEPNVVCLAVFDLFVGYLLSPQCANGVCMLYYVPHIPTCADAGSDRCDFNWCALLSSH